MKTGNSAGATDRTTGKVYFVEFPPAPAPETPSTTDQEPETATDIASTENREASLFADDEERSEWAPPGDLPAWWTRGGAQG